MKRETSKTIEVQGKKFVIRSFDAFTGAYIAFTLMEKMLPMGVEDKVKAAMRGEGKDVDSLPTPNRALMSKGEFYQFMKDCLSVVYEVFPARTAPVLNANGSWADEELKDNAPLAIILVIQALMFNVSGFFTGGGLQELKEGLQSLNLANTKM